VDEQGERKRRPGGEKNAVKRETVSDFELRLGRKELGRRNSGEKDGNRAGGVCGA